LGPKGLEVLSQRHNTVLLEVIVWVVLLNVKIDILVKVEVLAVQYTWCPFLGLLNFFTRLPQPDLPQLEWRTL
jgi:hypothetical protein